MKNKNFYSFVRTLVIGLMVGGGVIGVVGQNNPKVPKKNTTKEEQIGLKKKLKPPYSPGHFWRMTLDKRQYDSMTIILNTPHLLTTMNAFRLTSGQMKNGNYSILIDGIDKDGSVIPNTSKTTDMGMCLPNFAIIYLTMDQYNAMKKILAASTPQPQVAGFRLTPGNNTDGKECIFVCGVDPNGNDILSTNQSTFSIEPCPPNCDCTKAKK